MPIAAAARIWLAVAGLAGAAGVALAAAVAHEGLPAPDLAGRAAEFLLLHAPALAATAWLADRRGGALPQLAGVAFAAGLILFSGTLGMRGLGLGMPAGMAPLGGLALIAGWLALTASAAWRRR